MPSEIRGSDNFSSDSVGKVLQVETVQTRTQGTYSAPTSGNGTEVTPLTLTLTPTTAGNKVILEWHVNGEMPSDSVYLVTRNDVLLADSTDASNNRWAGIMAQPYDYNSGSTPDNAIVRIIDNNCLDVSSTYKLQIRSSYTSTLTLYLNRTVSSSGTNQYETSLSTAIAMEIAQ